MGCSLMFGFLGFLAWELFKFFLATASDGIPRAVRRAGRAGAPSTPGRLGVFIGMGARWEWLQISSFSGSWINVLFASFPVASSDGVPRAVKRAGRDGAPSTPGGLRVFIGMGARWEWLQISSFSGSWISVLFASFPVASSDGVPRAVKRAGRDGGALNAGQA